jgi:hypothetical protein
VAIVPMLSTCEPTKLLGSISESTSQCGQAIYPEEEYFLETKMWQSVKAKVDDLWATESHQLCKQMIHNICTAMVALVNGAEKMSTTKHKQLQVHLNAV